MFAPSTASVDVQQTPERDMDTGSDSVVLDLPTDQAEEVELSYLDQDISVTDNDQTTIKEQNYRETMSGLRS